MNGKEVNAYGDKGGAFGKLEKAWADALKAGKTVHVEIECIYDAGNTTPLCP